MKIFVTGITGTLGTALVYENVMRMQPSDLQIVGYSRDEQKQRTFPYAPRCTLYLGDVRDRDRLLEAARGADIIFHLAALKCVDTLELNPEEAISTNIKGTENVLFAQRILHVPKVVLASTDKAVEPHNAYGMAKGLAEKLVLRNPSNCVCRYGNVLGSRGSVLPFFTTMIRTGKVLPITHQSMTRFWITQADAARFVWDCAFNKTGLQIIPCKSYSLVGLCELLASIVGKPFKYKEVGLRPGEKIHETLRLESEGGLLRSNDPATQWHPDELREVLREEITYD